jgi:hypothetical protein
VEFEIGHDDDGKVKAVSVTAPGGGPCTGPRKSRNNRRREAGEQAPRTGNVKGPPKPRDPFWHEDLSDAVKAALAEKEIRTSTGTIDVSVGDSRVKLGTNGYSSMAHADGIIAEGSFTCDADGNAAFVWSHCISFSNGDWVASAEKMPSLVSSFSLSDGKLFTHSRIHGVNACGKCVAHAIFIFFHSQN